MQQNNPPSHNHHNGNAGEDRATGVLLSGGFNDGVLAFILRQWLAGTNPLEPVFVTWLLDIGRFSRMVKYGHHSLQGGQWHVDTASVPRIRPSPLEQAGVAALPIREILEGRLNRPLIVAPALPLFDTNPDRRIEPLARHGCIPLVWDLESYTGKVTDAAAGDRLRQPLERWQALAKVSAFTEGTAPAGDVPPRMPSGPHRHHRWRRTPQRRSSR